MSHKVSYNMELFVDALYVTHRDINGNEGQGTKEWVEGRAMSVCYKVGHYD